jgi:Fe-S-cluster-containing hydrogenase component 2
MGNGMKVIVEKCKKCLACLDVCPVKAISEKNGKIVIDENKCLGCGCCASSCPNHAIEYD